MSNNKYFSSQKDDIRVTNVNPFHSIQWMTILYYCSNELFKIGSSLCDKVYYLNKIMHSVDLFYAIDLPDVWSAEHPLGSVMGRAKYSDGFFFYQGCTVGGTSDKYGNDIYPIIEKNVHMYANSSILGNCHIGEGTQIGAGTLVKNQDVPANSIVFGQSPNLIIKERK
ncbi:MAG: serine O-acetyltransferase [Bacteroidaceae bacterium]|nr:serine O-acetyltransferase [Bacteroidaceae bacterium]